jgi:hypothetical protein
MEKVPEVHNTFFIYWNTKEVHRQTQIFSAIQQCAAFFDAPAKPSGIFYI